MKIIKDLSWILLVNSVSSLNLSHKVNVDETSSMSSFFATPKGMCDSTAANVTTIQDLNSTSSKVVNISCVSTVSEDTAEIIDFDTLKKIEYYNHLAKRIWSISPPILFGKKS